MTNDINSKIQEELERREDIINNLTDNYFVEAGAGAGKTYTIVQRIINQLKSGVVKADELVVITFTKKAAAELYDRISADLAAEMNNAALDDKQREALNDAMLHIDTMTVSTIHSFCRKLLSERAFDANIPLDTPIIEAKEEKALKQKFFEDWFLKNSNKADSIVKDAISHSQSYVGKPGLWNYKKLAFETFVEISNKMLDDELEVFYPESPLDPDKDYEQMFAGMYGNFVSEIKNFVTAALKNENADWKYILQDKALKKADSEIDFVFFVCENIKETTKIFKTNNVEGIGRKNIQTFRKEFEEFVKQNISIHGKDIADYTDYGMYAIIKTAVEAAKEYNAARPDNKLTNDDLLYKSRKLLLSSPDAREYFANKYKCIYIDEFQDTDHIQKEMLWALACGNNESLRPGSLFVVGDAKQSIYRFRGAEPEIFAKTREEMRAAGAKTEKLSINFRSNQDIINWVNGKYKDKLKATEEYEDMLCVNNDEECENCLHGVYDFISNDESDKRTNVIDAEELCTLIKKLVNDKKQVIEKKDGKRIPRPIKYSDFLVLVKAKTNAMTYKKAFRENNIPVIFGMDKDVSEDAAISRFTVLYNFLANSYDKKSIAGAMIVFLDYDKKTIADARTDLSVRDFFNAKDDEWNEALEQITALYEYTRSMSAYGIAEYLSHRLDLLLPKGYFNKAQMTSAVSAIRQMVDTVLASNKGSRQTLAEAFTAYRNAMAANDLPLAPDYNAVRFMNVHQAKGLEGNIVIIADIGATNTMPGAHKFGNIFYPVVKAGNNNTVKYNVDAQNDEKNARNAEDVRLEYVTATRAKEALIFMPKVITTNPQWITSKSSVEVLSDNFGVQPDADDEPTTVENSTPDTEVILQKDPMTMLSEIQKTAVYKTVNPSRMENPAKQVKKEDKTDENDAFEGENIAEEEIAENVISPEVDGDVGLESAEKKEKIRADYLGTAMHRMFELTVNRFISGGKDKTGLPEYLNYAVNQALIEGMDDMGEKADVYEKRLKAFAAAFEKDEALHNRIADADTVYTELPFSFFVSDSEAEELAKNINADVSNGDWVNGTADLVLVKGDTVTVLDYKSNHNKDGIPDFVGYLREHYKGQLALYAFAMKKLLGKENVETDIVNYQTEG